MKTNTVRKLIFGLNVTISLGIILVSCQKDEFPHPNTLPEGLTGSWIETNTRTDTIRFNSDNLSGYFFFSGGFAFPNGYWLPKIGSAPYSYKITGDSITVLNGLSSGMWSRRRDQAIMVSIKHISSLYVIQIYC